MSCIQKRKEWATYENIKRLARIVADEFGQTTFIYRQGDEFRFDTYTPGDPRAVHAVEYILPVRPVNA